MDGNRILTACLTPGDKSNSRVHVRPRILLHFAARVGRHLTSMPNDFYFVSVIHRATQGLSSTTSLGWRQYARAERGLRRFVAAVSTTEALLASCRPLKLDSMERIDRLETLKKIVFKLEEMARRGKPNDGLM